MSLHQNPKSVYSVDIPHQEGREVNTNTLPPPYQGLPPPSQVSEAKWEDIAQPEGGTGQQPKCVML